MPKTIVLDIETAPLPESELAPLMPEFSAPSTWKDPEKIKAAIETKRAEWLESCALDALTCRVLAIGLVNLSDIEIIGRGFNYATAFELALKLKELAYVHAEPYSSADFLHGPVALVDERFRAWVFAPTGATYSSAVEFTERIKRGGARVIGVSDNEAFLNLCDAGMRLPPLIPEWLSPLVAILPGQLFALHLALAKGLDVDHPRNLTKVTYTR